MTMARKPITGLPIATGRLDRTHSSVMEPPELRPGQVRCPACRNGVTPIGSGALRRHRDLFGGNCGNWTADLTTVRVVAPPVDFTSESTLAAKPNGHCWECTKRIPPGRRLCGRCNARRSA